MRTFKDLDFKTHSTGSGDHAIMNFDNDYGVSVVKFPGSYGYHLGLWEVAILYKGELTYNTPITSDVIGHQSEEEVSDIMKQVQEL